jgi:hypothetical protein
MTLPRALVHRTTRALPIACNLPGPGVRSLPRAGKLRGDPDRRIGLGQHGRVAAEEAEMNAPRKPGKASTPTPGSGRRRKLSRSEIDSITKIVLASGPDDAIQSMEAYPELFANPEAREVYLTTLTILFGIPEEAHASGKTRQARTARARTTKTTAKSTRKTKPTAVPRKTGSR